MTDINATTDLTLVIGGTRSGKSEYAEQLTAALASDVLYIATAENKPGSGSMGERILRHRKRRPKNWETFECPLHLAQSIRESRALDGKKAVLLDCVTLLTSNILFSLDSPENLAEFERALTTEAKELAALIKESAIPWVIVSSETGLGLAAPDQISRNYCDGLGLMNKTLAELAGKVYLVVAGLPLVLK